MKTSKKTKGDILESQASLVFHQKGIPVLVSPKYLREKGCGQVDVCRIVEERGDQLIEILEVKTEIEIISPNQHQRLRKSSQLLSEVFCLASRLKFVGKR
jgi:hypothetical protein